ncbi:MAG TPA: redoxin family protein [Acidobacteriaceae bacterium]
MRIIAGVVLWLLGVGTVQAQAPTEKFTDPAKLLDAVAKTYAGADTFHFQSITERVANAELHRSWEKEVHTVIKARGNRFRIEARTWLGTWMQDSDGTTEWSYAREGKIYVKRPAGEGPQFPKMYGMGTMHLRQAWDMRTFLDAEATSAKHATMLPEETIQMEGKSYPCYVVHATNEGQDFHSDQTFWIGKKTLLIRKEVKQEATAVIVSSAIKMPQHEEETILYPIADLDPQIDPKLFQFTPPSDAKEVATLEPNIPGNTPPPASSLAGKQLPDITLTDANGRETKLSSFRGHPLLIDSWATWCGPCLEWMPSLGRLEKEMRAQGLQVISVDRDEAAENATHYMAVHGFTWPNYHDAEGKLSKALAEKRIPLTVLVDAKGQVTYMVTDSDEAALRKPIVALLPDTAVHAAN